jgi:hypothetical protein
VCALPSGISQSPEVAGRPGKFYDITNTSTGSKIASDLRLYEAALLLTQELNKGKLHSSHGAQILQLEEEFAKNLEDAAAMLGLPRRRRVKRK